MDPGQITYGELKSFKEKIFNYNSEEILNLYLEHLEFQKKEEIEQKVLDLFPKFEGQKLEINFIDKEKTMAVVTVYRYDEIVCYFSYCYDYGILGNNFKSFDQAILGCLCKKYGGTPSPLYWFLKMMEIPDTIKNEQNMTEN